MTPRIIRIAAGLYAVVEEGQAVPLFTGSYAECEVYLEGERLHLCRG